MRTDKAKTVEADTRPDAWQRFEKAVDIGLQTKPMHRETPKPKRKAKSPRKKA